MAQELGPIQVVPAGLLGFFQLKNAGRAPDMISTLVQPTLDLWTLYRGQMRETRRLPQILAPQSGMNDWTLFTNGESAIVPENQFWWVDYFTAFTTVAAASERIEFAACVVGNRDGDGQQSPVMGVSQPTLLSTEVGETTSIAMCSADRSFLMSPGDRFGTFWMREFSVSGVSVEGNVRFVRMRDR